MKQLKVRIIGVSPLLCHNGQTVDPLNKYTQAIKTYSSKRKKTDADFEAMARLEWEAGLYLKGGKPCIPGLLLEACIREAGKTKKLGKVVLGAVFCDEDPMLEFPEEKLGLDELYKKDEYRFTAKVVIQRSSIMRTRPMFNAWEFDTVVNYDENLIDTRTMKELLEIAGTKGLGDWRPKFGRFSVKEV